jgi:hypothetical protein
MGSKLCALRAGEKNYPYGWEVRVPSQNGFSFDPMRAAALAAAFLLFPLAGCALLTPKPVDWLLGRPFVPAPEWVAPVISEGLPEGFKLLPPESASELAPEGYTFRSVKAIYQLSTGGQVTAAHEIAVLIFSFSEQAGRAAFLGSLSRAEIMGDFVTLAGGQVVRFHDSSNDARMWISGPYLLSIEGGLDPSLGDRNPWVDSFAELYLAKYPPRADLILQSPTPSPADWLRGQPFVPAPDWTPPVLTRDLPEGYQMTAGELDFDWAALHELASGLRFHRMTVSYSRQAGDPTSDPERVDVQFYGFAEQASRDAIIRMNASNGDFTWVLEALAGQPITRAYSTSSDIRCWIAGPYLILVNGERDPETAERNPLVDRFAELYLGMYPPRADLALPSPTPLYAPFTWLKEAPFIPAPAGEPVLLRENLPEGFTMLEPEPIDGTTSEGYPYWGVRVDYQLLEVVQDTVIPYKVEVLIFGFSEQAGRDAQLDTLPLQSLGCEFVSVEGQQVVRFFVSSTDARMWVSGSYLLMVATGDNPGAAERDPRVDLFTGRYLALYPSR